MSDRDPSGISVEHLALRYHGSALQLGDAFLVTLRREDPELGDLVAQAVDAGATLHLACSLLGEDPPVIELLLKDPAGNVRRVAHIPLRSSPAVKH